MVPEVSMTHRDGCHRPTQECPRKAEMKGHSVGGGSFKEHVRLFTWLEWTEGQRQRASGPLTSGLGLKFSLVIRGITRWGFW